MAGAFIKFYDWRTNFSENLNKEIIIVCTIKSFCNLQYAAKEYQQALDILDMEEAASKKILEKNVKEDNGSKETVKEWEMSPASVSPTLLFIYSFILAFSRMKMTLDFFFWFLERFLGYFLTYYVLFLIFGLYLNEWVQLVFKK